LAVALLTAVPAFCEIISQKTQCNYYKAVRNISKQTHKALRSYSKHLQKDDKNKKKIAKLKARLEKLFNKDESLFCKIDPNERKGIIGRVLNKEGEMNFSPLDKSELKLLKTLARVTKSFRAGAKLRLALLKCKRKKLKKSKSLGECRKTPQQTPTPTPQPSPSPTPPTRNSPVCGNGIVETGEDCDDGNIEDGDGCSSTCQIEFMFPTCGNGILEPPEECDDGNTVNGDGCDSECRNESPPSPQCGNGVVENGEECDDGNIISGDGCSSTCQNEIPNPPPPTPNQPVCGNKIIENGEQCDDGNTTDGDGCSSSCQTETPNPPPPTPASPVCGNNIVEDGEQCDDGNTTDGDGCSSSCQVENQPAQCGNGIIETGEVCECGADGVCGNNDDDVGSAQCSDVGGNSGEVVCESCTGLSYTQCSFPSSTIFVDNQLTSDCLSGDYSIANRDCSGNDGAAYNTLAKAANAARDPDTTVLIRGGDYVHSFPSSDSALLKIRYGGIRNHPITYRGFGSERPRLIGQGYEDRDLDNDGLADGPPVSTEYLILVDSNARYIKLQQLEVMNSARYGIYLAGDNTTVEDIKVHDNWDAGIFIRSDNNLIRFVEAYNQRHFTGVILRGSSGSYPSGNIIEESLSYRNGYLPTGEKVLPTNGDPAGGGNADGFGASKNCYQSSTGESLCQNNIVRNNVAFGNADDGYDFSMGNSIVEGNISFNNGPEGNQGFKVLKPVNGLAFIGNISLGNVTQGFDIRSGPLGGIYINNLAAHNGRDGIGGIRNSSRFHNNLGFGNFSTDIEVPAPILSCSHNWSASGIAGMANNCSDNFSGSPGLPNEDFDVADVNTTFPEGLTIAQKVQFIRDQFKAAFAPTANSPVVDAGTVVIGYHCTSPGPHPGQSCREWYGQAPDIGPFEYIPSQ
ncbi:MAG: DUF4215 domain-containing protein, partial [Candidatus Dadabacteria bacterium]